ncbi:uncharacterized protein LY89DRAFT_489285 [Mollisia scopiformis]|uniref:2EXR domain-containing protein n=1 Tax=Mollisia scopiformis TaxID=149040 RepID=A0A194XGU8_MOLSC|nr:uncharacterized protein LY89DRAFT_489285 [Mollisia scopiformis]KUJ19366.1 hypothetical protein LY89DRAFT_489285 [Mollisia scopiformis]
MNSDSNFTSLVLNSLVYLLIVTISVIEMATSNALTTAISNQDTSTAADIAQPLETFTLFPGLPIELRRQIWQHALPPATRLIPLRLKYKAPSENEPEAEDGSQYSFVHGVRGEQVGYRMWVRAKDLALLEVCREARAEYLMANSNILPGISKRKIYYPDAAIIYIQNWYSQAVYDYTEAAKDYVKEGGTSPGWFSGVKRLAVPNYSISVRSRSDRTRRYRLEQGEANIRQLFSGLKELIGISISSADGESMAPRDCMRSRMQASNDHRAENDPSYVVPKLTLLEHILGSGLERWSDCS